MSSTTRYELKEASLNSWTKHFTQRVSAEVTTTATAQLQPGTAEGVRLSRLQDLIYGYIGVCVVASGLSAVLALLRETFKTDFRVLLDTPPFRSTSWHANRTNKCSGHPLMVISTVAY